MAQTIKIKKSNSSLVPSADLAHGELAYGTVSGTGTDGKLSIGRPGTSAGAEVNDVIGGRYYTVAIDNATDNNSSGTLVKRGTGNSFSSGKITIESGGIQVDAHGASGTTAGTSNNWNTAYTLANDALPLSGGTLTGGLLGTTASFSGATALNDSSINVGFNSGNAEIKAKGATGSLSSHMDLYTTNSSGLTGLKLRILAGGGLSVGTGTVTMDGAIEGVHALSMSGALTGATTIAASTSVTSPHFLGNATTATTATNVNLTNLANNSSDTGPKYLTFSGGNSGSQPLETQDLLYYNPDTAYLTTKNIEVQSGMITGPSVMTIDPNGTGASGELIIQGSLTVKGTTTTIDSNTLSVGDSLIVLNGDENGTPSENAGIEVERGTSGNVSLQWVETGTTSSSYWAVNDASGVSPYYYPILHTRNAHEQTYTIEGGAF